MNGWNIDSIDKIGRTALAPILDRQSRTGTGVDGSTHKKIGRKALDVEWKIDINLSFFESNISPDLPNAV